MNEEVRYDINSDRLRKRNRVPRDETKNKKGDKIALRRYLPGMSSVKLRLPKEGPANTSLAKYRRHSNCQRA